jgi:PPM family protein phosphatase
MIGKVGHDTNRGRKRRHNEDSYVVEPPLFAVADGMGGAQAGEVASRLAAAVLQEESRGGAGEEHVVGLIQEANRRVYERGREDASASGLGTTITVALVEDGNVLIGHVGDSRAYRIREGSIEQLTNDHSLVAELVRSGRISPEEAESHPQRSVITRALGTDPDVDIDRLTVEARSGDVFLLCSDGLTSMVDDESILGIVERNREDLDRAVKSLIKEANRGGGEDNITVVAFEIADARTHGDADETLKMDAAADDAVPDEDDTLDELDRVPAVDTMVVPVEQARAMWERTQADAEPVDELPWRRPLALLLLVLLAIGALVVWRLVL